MVDGLSEKKSNELCKNEILSEKFVLDLEKWGLSLIFSEEDSNIALYWQNRWSDNWDDERVLSTSLGRWIDCEEIYSIVQKGNVVGEVCFGFGEVRSIIPLMVFFGKVYIINLFWWSRESDNCNGEESYQPT